jgi:nucleoredoxin
MDAELVSVDADIAVFKKDNGLHYKIPLADLCQNDQAYIAANQSKESVTTETPERLPNTELTDWLEKRLIARDGKRVKRTRDSALPTAKYIAFYYSASWCPPCRKFTPKLVKFYNEHRSADQNFEIIFVSSDRNEDAQEGYMLEDQMNWPALEFDDVREERIRKSSGTGIPCLVIVDREGKVIADSYVNGKYLGPTRIMNKLAELIAE